jgi:hypothetical protein
MMTEDIAKTLLTVMHTTSVDSFNQQFHHLQDYDAKSAANGTKENAGGLESEEIDDDDLGLEIDDELDSDLQEARGGSKKKNKKPVESNDGDDDVIEDDLQKEDGCQQQFQEEKAQKGPNAPKKPLSSYRYLFFMSMIVGSMCHTIERTDRKTERQTDRQTDRLIRTVRITIRTRTVAIPR